MIKSENKPILSLFEAVDIPSPKRERINHFNACWKCISILGRGTVATENERGVIKPGEEIEIVGLKRPTCIGIEKTLDYGESGDMLVSDKSVLKEGEYYVNLNLFVLY